MTASPACIPAHRRAFRAPAIGKADLLRRLRENEAVSRGDGWLCGGARSAPTRRSLVDRQLTILTHAGRSFSAISPPAEAVAIADRLGITPAIASALREQLTFLEQPGASWAVRFAEALVPGTDTAGLARTYAEHLSDVFDSSRIGPGPRARLAELVYEARDVDVDALPDLMALAALETTRAAGLSGRGPYLRAYLRAGELLLDLLALAAPRVPRNASPIREIAHV